MLWLGQVTHSVGLWMDLVARPILVIAMTDSAVHVGLVTLARGAPMMFLGPIAGVLADRVDRRVLLLVAKSITLVVNVAFVTLIFAGMLELWHVYVTAVIKSVLMAFDRPARQALLPAMVPPRLLMNALAINMGSMQIMRILSASITGFLIAVWAVAFGFRESQAQAFGGVYLVVAVTYVASIATTYLITVPVAARAFRTSESWAASFFQGVRFAWRNPVIMGILFLLAVQSVFGMPYLHVFVPWLALRVMDIGAEGAGLLMAVSATGSLLAAVLVAARGADIRRRGRWILAGMVFKGAALAVLGLTSTLPLVVVLGLALPLLPVLMVVLVGIGQTAIQTMKNALLLEVTPNELRGRIMSLHQMDRGLSTLGGSLAGFAIAVMGGPYALAVFGGLCILGALVVAALAPDLRKVE